MTVAFRGFTLGPVDLSLRGGEFLSVIGPNGSGKTTFVTALLGLLPPTLGVSTWEGQDLARRFPDVLTHVGFVSDSPDDVLQEFTAEEYWQYCRLAHESARKAQVPESTELARTLASQLDFPLGARKPLAKLSLGTRRKAQMIAALMMRPSLLVLDEPFIGLDFISSRALERILSDCLAEGTAIVSSSHDLDLASRISTKVLVLHDGLPVLNSGITDVGGHDKLEAVVLRALDQARETR